MLRYGIFPAFLFYKTDIRNVGKSAHCVFLRKVSIITSYFKSENLYTFYIFHSQGGFDHERTFKLGSSWYRCDRQSDGAGTSENGKTAVCSWNRTYEKAVAFAEKYGVQKVYSEIDEMFTDENVDIIYITSLTIPIMPL